MRTYNQMKSVKEKVRFLLTQTPHLRDDDNKLIATIYYNQIGKERLDLMTGMDFLRYFADGKLPSMESIRRVRCILQAAHPELRGQHYDSKQTAGKKVSQKINTEL